MPLWDIWFPNRIQPQWQGYYYEVFPTICSQRSECWSDVMSVCRASFMNLLKMNFFWLIITTEHHGVWRTHRRVLVLQVLQSASLLYRPLNCQLVSIRVRVRGGRFSSSGWDMTSSATYSTFCRTASHQKSERSLFPLQGAAVPWTALIPIARRVKQLHTVLLYVTLLTAYSFTRNTQSFKYIHIFFSDFIS